MTRRYIDTEDDAIDTRAKAAEEKRARTRALQETRAAKTASSLKRWQRRLRAAQNKVRKLKQRVKYYATKLA